MKIPAFNSTRATTPAHILGTEQLGWALQHDPILRQRTEAVRSADDPGRLKLKLPGVCLGGTFAPLPVTANHGPRCRGRCWPSGYRNGLHIDWTARTGLVMVDVDDLQPPATPDEVKFLLRYSAPAVAAAWTSARGKGLKLGVLVDPIPDTAHHNRDAWAAARDYIADVLAAAGLTEGVDYRIDATPAAAQLAILAHDSAPVVRSPETAVKWEPTPPGTPRPAWQQSAASLTPASSIWGLVGQLSWAPGSRSNSMHRLGVAAALSGLVFETARADARAVAETTGLVRDYGEYEAVRHFDRGFFWARELVLDGFGVAS